MMYISILETKSRKYQIEVTIIMKYTSYVELKEKEERLVRVRDGTFRRSSMRRWYVNRVLLKCIGLGQEGREGSWEEGTV